jgi:O-succinylbenzoic acid--CoA ligase
MNYKNYTSLILNGQLLNKYDIVDYCKNSSEEFLNHIADFLIEWFNEDETIALQTSGSTGTPKKIIATKKQMLYSAAATAKYFNFKENDVAVLALPANYIAGKMMIVRALLSKLNLVCIKPSTHPFLNLDKNLVVDFMPLTPAQLSDVKDTLQVKKILLGGAPVSNELIEQCNNLSAAIYHGYGMTETLSHIALRKINGQDKSTIYTALPNVSFTQDERDCLIIETAFLTQPIITNDIVQLIDNKSFIWKGRFDNVINSGGIKLFAEAIENNISNLIHQNFFIAAIPDKTLGEKLCLFIEGNKLNEELLIKLKKNLADTLSKYDVPKEIYFIDKFAYTASNKIQRLQTLEQFLKIHPLN